MVHIAIAGSGDLARYICEESTKAGHLVTVLTRSRKAQFDADRVNQRITDYTLKSVTDAIADCDVLISTILDYSSTLIDVHLTLIQACQLSPKCKRFIPSEYAGNIEDYPEQPAFYYHNHEPIRQALRDQKDIEWTLVSVGWLIDYTVPTKNRHLKDIGEAFPVNLADRKLVIPGTGTDLVSFTWARDVAKGLAVLVNAPTWDDYTYIAGEAMCWNDVADAVKRTYGQDFDTEYRSHDQLAKTIKDSNDEYAVLVAEYQIFSLGPAALLPEDRVLTQRQKYFQRIKFRKMQDGLRELDNDGDIIV
ncbi:hypothetical protein EsH8_IV_000008 [Colletotrichum jinshuiense]